VQDRLAQGRDHAATGGRLAAGGPAERDRLPGHDGRIEARELAVLVHHPGHHLRVGVDVRRRDVAVGADELADAIDELPRDVLELVLGELIAGAVDSALRSAERNVDDGRLPAHQRGERPDLVEVDGLVVAHAALVGPPSRVVLHAITTEDMHVPVAQANGDLNRDLAVGRGEHRPDVVVEAEVVGGDIEVVVDRLQRGEVGRGGRGRGGRLGGGGRLDGHGAGVPSS